MTWWDQRMVAFDCETTGVDVESARIVTAAIAFVGGGEPTETVTVLADPGIPIPDEAAAVHGVTTERAQRDGMPAAEAIALILEALSRREPESALIAFNGRFDLTILDRETRRHELAPPDEMLVVDPLVVDKHLDRFRRGSRKLDAMCEHYRATLDGAHDAASDAVAAARLAWRLGRHGDVVRRVRDAQDARELVELRREWDDVRGDLPALHRAQQRWALEQARGLEEYFARQGKPERVEGAWPVVPARVEAST